MMARHPGFRLKRPAEGTPLAMATVGDGGKGPCLGMPAGQPPMSTDTMGTSGTAHTQDMPHMSGHHEHDECRTLHQLHPRHAPGRNKPATIMVLTDGHTGTHMATG